MPSTMKTAPSAGTARPENAPAVMTPTPCSNNQSPGRVFGRRAPAASHTRLEVDEGKREDSARQDGRPESDRDIFAGAAEYRCMAMRGTRAHLAPDGASGRGEQPQRLRQSTRRSTVRRWVARRRVRTRRPR